MGLPREERQETVRSMREHGMSPGAIAAATGMGRTTVRRELDASGWPFGHPVETIGTDGKTYAHRFMSIASNAALANTSNCADLPAALRTLAELSRLDASKVRQMTHLESAPTGRRRRTMQCHGWTGGDIVATSPTGTDGKTYSIIRDEARHSGLRQVDHNRLPVSNCGA